MKQQVLPDLHQLSKQAEKKLEDFPDKYKTFLKEHQDPNNRKLHLLSSLTMFIGFILFAFTFQLKYLLMIPDSFAFNCLGHYFFERNLNSLGQNPVTSSWCISFLCQHKMSYDILSGNLSID